ncbi:MAG: GIY-YIG nuclease family protein [Snowella sp.]|nr:GIY-YIG nuclease family protein [Snowella sp.]
MKKQLSLFDSSGSYYAPRSEKLILNKPSLIQWKERIFHYQQQVQVIAAPQQQTLFELSQTTWHSPEEINPFSLPLHSSLFWRQAASSALLETHEQGCLYFIIDSTLPLLLYVGETKLTANQRWKGTHDCKSYILQYIELHRRYDLGVKVSSAFWQLIPSKKVLQQWERELILKWRSPFNKECWQWWGQPFGKD